MLKGKISTSADNQVNGFDHLSYDDGTKQEAETRLRSWLRGWLKKAILYSYHEIHKQEKQTPDYWKDCYAFLKIVMKELDQ